MRASPSAFISLLFLASVNVVALLGCSPAYTLHQNIYLGDTEAARGQIKGGADVNGRDVNGTTLLFAAVFNRNSEIAGALIQNGSDVNAKNKNGGTPLHAAAAVDDVKLAMLLINSGANVNSANDLGETPLFTAKARGHISVAKILISKGGQAPLRNKDGRTPVEAFNYAIQFWAQKAEDAKQEQLKREQAAVEQTRRDKAESREMWKGAATLATGVAVGNATRGYTPDQQARMMKSSMGAVQTGDTRDLTNTTNQIKAESAQQHQAKMQAIETQKERERAAQSRSNQSNRTSNVNSSRNGGATQVAMNQNGVRADSSSTTENWKPAFKSKSNLDDCTKKSRESSPHLSCNHEEMFKPAFTAADASAAEQSQMCSQLENRAKSSNNFYVIVEDFGCGCGLGEGRLMCTYFTLGKSRQTNNSGSTGRSK